MQARALTHSMSAHRREQAVESFRTRVVWLAFAREVLAWEAGWLMAYGCVILGWRAFHLAEAPLAWGLLGAVPAAIGAGVVASRQAPSRRAVLALLDEKSGAHGLMLLGEEQGDLGAWENRIASPAEVGLSWNPGRTAAAALLSAAFLAAALLVPMPPASGASRTLDIGSPVAQLEAKVEAMREEKLLDEQAAAALKERLNQLKAQAQGENPAKTWEALDHLAAEVQAAADKAAEELDKDAKAADSALNLGAVLDAHAGELSKEQVEAARAEQERREEKAFKEATDGGLPGVQPPPALRIPPELLPKMTPKQREAMREFLKENREALQQMAQKMRQAGLGPDNLPKNLTPEQMQRLLQQLKDGKCPGCQGGPGNGAEGGQRQEGGKPGSGGWNQHSEGGGPNDLTWQDPSTKEGANFDPKALTTLPDLTKTIKLGESATAPTVDGKTTSASAGGGLAEGANGGGSAARQNVLPRHRKAVDAYFERK